MLLSTVRQWTRLSLHGGYLRSKYLNPTSKLFSTKDSDDDPSLKLSQPLERPLKPSPVDTKDVDPDLIQAAQGVAEYLNKNDAFAKNNTSNSLLTRLNKISMDTNAVKTSGGEISSLYSSLSVQSDKIEVQNRRKDLTDEQKVFLERRKFRRKEMREQGSQLSSSYVSGNLFASKPLGIFPPGFKEKDCNIDLKTWDECLQRDLEIIMTPRPKNFLEEMILMTDKGMLWELPLNNEFGINDEEIEPFHLHVFLEKHLESWCPKTGPIRHFMELVTVGLSKNPYMSVQKKIEHIQWFESYLMASDKQEIFNIMETESSTFLPKS
ncbi:small ribosomal subunit protein mS31 [Lepeophtheirus salmonis]|uniref:small ribosomal subunit protein mS31 n=1 Tax=Lepeophtheirus salmonis TaxID=72036 RepID=UPI001AE352FE|nr:28S ribosomal protein S31, mitochondrial-like [Lepeophtheirus salmonis]